MSRIIYNKELLNKRLLDDNATLVVSVSNPTSETRIKFICSCGSEGEKLFRGIIINGGAFCKKCVLENAKKKRIETNKKLFGAETPLQNKEIVEKVKCTNLEKYGKEYALSSNDVIEKRKRTLMLKPHFEKIQSIEKQKNSVKNKSIEEKNQISNRRKTTNLIKYGVTTTLLIPAVQEKSKKTLKEKYGVESNISQSTVIREKIKKNCLEKYGVENHQSREDIKQKTKLTNLEKYGAISPTCAPFIQNKVKTTNIEKYGVEYPMQTTELQEKSSKISKRFKNYILPSKQVIRVQGYEPFALNELLQSLHESQIKTSRKDVPRIEYSTNEIKRFYFPDIFIPCTNTIIEVKSTWTFSCKKDNIYAKAKSCISHGYNYEIWIYDNRKNKKVISSF
jgi:hypothetical protein